MDRIKAFGEQAKGLLICYLRAPAVCNCEID